ncbi:phosphate starvation-inducible protein PsiH [Salinarimonas ramus]|uniref:Phosphate starvation-inducible protein PsiH n=1 Tax=Salinarimonas ramus TaxID=690164 RepID=A0A917V7L4_9HYPH|nr:phosphate starvation-inducible protein PsiH [Salinarimonas ramus]
MSKRYDKQKRRTRRSFEAAEIVELHGGKFDHERSLAPIKPLNATQAAYLSALRTHPQTIVLGPAGTGKTWMAAAHAADLFRQRRIGRIVLTRPNVPAGRSLGFFPGTLEEKFAPWAVPVVDTIRERIGRGAFDIAMKNGEIEMVPFEVMRGRSWSDTFVLLDEAQNATLQEMKTFLTRLGEDCTAVVNGDVGQCDLKETSGLAQVIAMIREQELPVPIIEFGADDIVRSGVCAMWVRAFARVEGA